MYEGGEKAPPLARLTPLCVCGSAHSISLGISLSSGMCVGSFLHCDIAITGLAAARHVVYRRCRFL